MAPEDHLTGLLQKNGIYVGDYGSATEYVIVMFGGGANEDVAWGPRGSFVIFMACPIDQNISEIAGQIRRIVQSPNSGYIYLGLRAGEQPPTGAAEAHRSAEMYLDTTYDWSDPEELAALSVS